MRNYISSFKSQLDILRQLSTIRVIISSSLLDTIVST